jgi:hypothetical protein
VLKNGLSNRFLKDEKRFFKLFDVILQLIKTIVIHDDDKKISTILHITILFADPF